MFQQQLQANMGKKIILELVNGRVVSGTVLNADQGHIHLETEEGVGTIALKAVQIVWENIAPSLTGGKMLRDKFEAETICHGTEYTCHHAYYCSRYHHCTRHFNCRHEFKATHKGEHHPKVFCQGPKYFEQKF